MSASRVEALRVAFRQDKEGYVITLRIHPSDLDHGIMTDPVGQRYYVTLVRVDDDERPMKATTPVPAGDQMVKRAAILCRDPTFQKWLVDRGYALEAAEEDATAALREALGVQSRAELKTNTEAQEKFELIEREYGS